MDKENKLFIYMGAGFAFLIFISIALAFGIYSGKAKTSQNIQNSSEQANITPVQTPFENPTPIPTAMINTQTSVQTTENNVANSVSQSGSNPETNPVNTQSPSLTDNKASEEKFKYAMLAIKNKDFDTAEKTFKELASKTEDDQWKQQSVDILKNMDKIKTGDFSGLIQQEQNNGMARQVQACIANTYLETDHLPKFNNLDEFKNFMVTNCGILKEATDEITNATIIDASPNYKINVSFKNGKTYQHNPTGFNEVTN